MKLGRIAPTAAHKARALPLARYLTRPLPHSPLALDNTPGATYRMYRNDEIGDCTVAALANFHATAAAREGRPFLVSDDEAAQYYFTLSGGKDDGLVEIDVLERAAAIGFPLSGAHKLAAWVRIDARDLESIRSCASLFWAVYVGAALPVTAQRQQIWDTTGLLVDDDAPGSWGGHAMVVPKYDAIGPTFITWGAQKRATWAWWRLYVDEAYALLDAERAQAAGVDWDALVADLKALDAVAS
jgi:hypothetical protein